MRTEVKTSVLEVELKLSIELVTTTKRQKQLLLLIFLREAVACHMETDVIGETRQPKSVYCMNLPNTETATWRLTNGQEQIQNALYINGTLPEVLYNNICMK
jgi:hypothetical protein